MKKLLRNSTEYSFTHCKARAKERYGKILTEHEYDLLNKMALNAESMDKRGSIVIKKVYLPTWRRFVYANFDTSKNRVTTLLPPEHFNYG